VIKSKIDRAGLGKLKDPLKRVTLVIGVLFVLVLSVSQYTDMRLHRMTTTADLINHTGKLRYLLKSYESELAITQLREYSIGTERENQLRQVSLEFQRRYLNLSGIITGELASLEYADQVMQGYTEIDGVIQNIFSRYDHQFDVKEANHLYAGQTFDPAVDRINKHIEYVNKVYKDRVSFYETIDTVLLVGLFALLAFLFVKVVRPSFRELSDSNERLQDALELNSVLISFASHQFKTPLTIIASNTELAKIAVERQAYDKIPGFCQRIEEAEKKFNEVIQTFFYMDSHFLFDKDDLEIVDIVCYMNQLVVDNSSGDEPQVFVQLETNEKNWRINPDAYKNIISNLVSNAIKYTNGGPQPIVVVRTDSKYYITEVKDFGIGIPSQELKDLFKPYKRMSNARTLNGTGLGLFIVKTIADKVGAQLEVSSEVGKGTIMRLKIPREQTSSTARAERESEQVV
jgi:signal transduction histidine kinase